MSAECKEMVWDRGSRYMRRFQCRNKAATAAGYCKVHDPELRKAREDAKPPGKFQRQNEARKQLDAYLASILTPEQLAIVQRGISWAHLPWVMPPWPLDITKEPAP
jgi:hypothetical protein